MEQSEFSSGRVITAIEKSGRKYRVFLQDEPAFLLSEEDLKRLKLYEGQELLPAEYEKICTDILRKDAVEKCLRMLERSDRTQRQLEQALGREGYPPAVIDMALASMRSYGYLDDLRFSRRFIENNQALRSRSILIGKLREKGVPDEIITQAVEEMFDADEGEQIRYWIRKKKFDPASSDKKERDRMIRFLAAKGYGWDQIRREL